MLPINNVNRNDITYNDVMIDGQWTDVKINNILTGHRQTDNIGHMDMNRHMDSDE